MDSSFAPPAEQFPNQLFEHLKKLYVLKPFINVDEAASNRALYLSIPK